MGNFETYAAYGRDIREAGRANVPGGGGYERIIFTNGCFDILHRGHMSTLRYARDMAGPRGVVVVGLNSDESVRRLKGEGRPVTSEEDRASVLCHLRTVDYVIVFDEDDPYELVVGLRPHVIVKGSDYSGKPVVGGDLAMVSYAPFVEGVSTTKILEASRG